jgi:asparagine synthase (glutamine-hydrolysing)
MCGLNGVLSLDPAVRVDEALIVAMRDTMVHRGPDGAGAWVSADGRLGLGHRRLAIVDLSPAGAQPMATEDGALRISFNGEIYNHVALRTELQALGHRFRGHCDTEVILHAYRAWGIDCLHRFRGMFAFALWDAPARRLWLVRDRIGIKPLYYARHNGRLAFASEIKALLADPALPRAVDEDALFHYLSFLATPAPQTLFKGINKLPGGSLLCVEADGTIEERRWWDPLDAVTDAGKDEAQGEETVARHVLGDLREAVALRKMADVPVGVFLSGGIDSSANAALFSEGGDGPVKTFSIGYDRDYGTYANELDYARQMAERIGADHHELRLTRDHLTRILPRMIALQDEPIADPVCVPLYYVSRLARQAGVVVCQVGEGADELFWGYPNWKRALDLQRLADRWPVPGAVKALGLGVLKILGKDTSQPYDWLWRSRHGWPIFWGGAEAFTQAEKRRLLSPRLRRAFKGRSSWEAIGPIRARWERKLEERGLDRSDLGWMTYLDLALRLPELLLMRVDKMSMGVSLEARVPFLDHRVVGYALGLSEDMKTSGGVLKRVLKRAVRGLVPDAIIDRPKQGFGVPVHEWLVEGLGAEVRETVDRFLDATDLLDADAVRRLLDDPRGRVHAWYILNLALWWQHYIAPERVGPVPADPDDDGDGDSDGGGDAGRAAAAR